MLASRNEAGGVDYADTQLPAATRHGNAVLHTMIIFIFKPSSATYIVRIAIGCGLQSPIMEEVPKSSSIVSAFAVLSRVHNGERAARRRRPSRRTKKLMAGADSARPAPPALPCTVRLQVLALEVFCDLSQHRDGTVNRFLFSLADRKTPARPRPDALGVRSADVVVDADRNLWARVFSPSAGEAEAGPLPVLVYFHGGGFALFSPASAPLDAMCRRLCRELRAVVVSVNYRRSPEHRYPAAYDDCADVLGYLGTTGLPADIGVPVDLSRCFLFGDSAGGNIAHHVAHRWTSSAAASSNNPICLAGIILLQPYFGGEERTEAELRLEGVGPVVNMRRSDWSWKAFLPEGADRNHLAAHVTGEAGPEPELPEAFPPAMVVVGGFDTLQDWQRRYTAMLQRKRKAVRLVEFPDAIHGFYMFPKLPDAGKLVKDVKTFMETDTPDH